MYIFIYTKAKSLYPLFNKNNVTESGYVIWHTRGLYFSRVHKAKKKTKLWSELWSDFDYLATTSYYSYYKLLLLNQRPFTSVTLVTLHHVITICFDLSPGTL